MNLFRTIILSAALCAGAVAASAKNINALVINRTDGVKDRLALHAELKVEQSPEGDLLLVHPSVTVCYPLDLIKNITAGFQSFATGQYYTGDHEYNPEEDAIEAPEIDGLNIEISDGLLTISGATTDVKIIDLQGKTRLAISPAGGRAQILTAQFPAGVYLLTANKTTLKIKL